MSKSRFRVGSAFDRIASDRLIAVSRRLMHAVRPIYVMRGKFPAHRGCGVVVAVRGAFFLLTAAHVIDETENEKVCISAAGLTLPIAGEGLANDPRPGELREDDSLDAGVIRLRSAIPAELAEAALSVRDLELNPPREPAGPLLLLGWAGNRTRVDPKSRTVRREPVRYAASEATTALYQAHGRNRLQHVAMRWDVRRIVRDGVRSSAPAFDGMSGCGMWRMDGLTERLIVGRREKLAAVFTDRRDGRPGVLVGTRVSVHVEVIRLLAPELSAHLPTTSVKLTGLRPRATHP